MNQPANNLRFIHRILVALDGSSASLAALHQAVHLAAHFEAEVLGLYVEDINLVRLTELTVSQEIGLFSGTRRQLEIKYVERQFRSQASRVRQALAGLAENAGVAWSFRVARGVIAAELLAAAADVDMLVLGRIGLSYLSGKEIGSTTRAILRRAPRLTLILQPNTRLEAPFMVLYNGSTVAQRALTTAVSLNHEQSDYLVIVMLSDDPNLAQQWQNEIDQKLKARGVTGQYLWQRDLKTPHLNHLIQSTGCRALIAPTDGYRLNPEAILILLNAIETPVLIVR